MERHRAFALSPKTESTAHWVKSEIGASESYPDLVPISSDLERRSTRSDFLGSVLDAAHSFDELQRIEGLLGHPEGLYGTKNWSTAYFRPERPSRFSFTQNFLLLSLFSFVAAKGEPGIEEKLRDFRRLLESVSIKGAVIYLHSSDVGSNTEIRLDVFLDDRYEEDLSFDRLGVRKVEAKIVDFLTPLAHNVGARRVPPKPFAGWLGIAVSELRNLLVLPDPIDGNPYHALLSRDGYRNKYLAETLAYRLCYHAHKIGLIPPGV
jgi:hypothetical protein